MGINTIVISQRNSLSEHVVDILDGLFCHPGALPDSYEEDCTARKSFGVVVIFFLLPCLTLLSFRRDAFVVLSRPF
jgi:hypothetical protein